MRRRLVRPPLSAYITIYAIFLLIVTSACVAKPLSITPHLLLFVVLSVFFLFALVVIILAGFFLFGLVTTWTRLSKLTRPAERRVDRGVWDPWIDGIQ
jgi:hypothetical protein